MSKQDPAEQVKFLVSCIGHTTNGRPDFQQVADALDIVSKAAAQKRYERLLKSYGITTKGGSVSGGTGDDKSAPSTPTKPTATPTKRKARATPAGSAKKRGKTTPKKEAEDEEAKPEKNGNVKDEDDAGSTSSLTDAPPSENDDAKSQDS